MKLTEKVTVDVAMKYNDGIEERENEQIKEGDGDFLPPYGIVGGEGTRFFLPVRFSSN